MFLAVFRCRAIQTMCSAGLAAAIGSGVGISPANGSEVTVGGIYLATDLINAANSTQFRSYPNTGLYIHNGGVISGINYGWQSLNPTQKEQMISLWGGSQSLELGWEADAVGWQNAYLSNYVPEGVTANEVSANVSTTDANGFASDTDAFAVLPASNLTGWTTYVDGFRNLSSNPINSIYPIYAPNLKGKDASGNAVDAWLMGGPGSNPFATGSFFADVRRDGGSTAVGSPSIHRPSNSSATSRPAPMDRGRHITRRSRWAKSPGRMRIICTASGSFRPTPPARVTTR